MSNARHTTHSEGRSQRSTAAEPPAEASGIDLGSAGDEDPAPVPPAQVAASYEAMEEGSKLAPVPPSHVAAAFEKRARAKIAKQKLEVVDDDGAPLPPEVHVTDQLQGKDIVLRSKCADAPPPSSGGRRAPCAGETAPSLPARRIRPGGLPPEETQLVQHVQDATLLPGDDEPADGSNTSARVENATIPTSSQEQANDSTPWIPEAFLVEDGGDEVVVGTPLEPTLPWWKQRRTRLLLAFIFILIAVFAIALGVALSHASASITSSPAFVPTASPTSSLAPSSSPSSCADTILSNVQQVDFRLDAPLNPRVAVDGSNMVAVVRDSKTSLVFTIFYSLSNDDEWEIQNVFQQRFSGSGFSYSSVALSGKTAIVAVWALVGGGTLAAYEQDNFGEWEEMEEPEMGDPFDKPSFSSIFNFAWFVDIDGPLACVANFNHVIYLFQRGDGNKWLPLGSVGGVGCSINGDIIAAVSYPDEIHGLLLQPDGMLPKEGVVVLYEYDEDLGRVVQIQDEIPASVNSGSLSQDYFAYSDWRERDVFIYRREESSQTFSFHKRLNVSAPGDIFAMYALALDGDVLAARGVNDTHIFAEQNGFWEEIIRLDEPYDSVQLSGHKLLVTKGPELFFYDIEACVPTQAQMPTIAPTSCYWVDIIIVFDEWPRNLETSWELQRIDTSGEATEAGAHSVYPGELQHMETFHKESLCLVAGQYEYTIFDMGGDGMSDGHYNITTSDGALIAAGANFEREEKTLFAIPFVPAPSAAPAAVSASKAPSNSPEEEI